MQLSLLWFIPSLLLDYLEFWPGTAKGWTTSRSSFSSALACFPSSRIVQLEKLDFILIDLLLPFLTGATMLMTFSRSNHQLDSLTDWPDPLVGHTYDICTLAVWLHMHISYCIFANMFMRLILSSCAYSQKTTSLIVFVRYVYGTILVAYCCLRLKTLLREI